MIQTNLKEKKEELESEYKDVNRQYTRQLIKVKTADFAIQDLEKYGKALDKWVHFLPFSLDRSEVQSDLMDDRTSAAPS